MRDPRAALTRYRVLANLVGVLLILLVFVATPLKYGADHPGMALWVGLAHGVFCYPLFILLTVDLGWRTRMPLQRLVLIVVLGTVPIASFAAERSTTRWVHERLGESATDL